MRELDKSTIDRQLKRVFLSETREDAPVKFDEFKSLCKSKHPRQIYNLGRNLNMLRSL